MSSLASHSPPGLLCCAHSDALGSRCSPSRTCHYLHSVRDKGKDSARLSPSARGNAPGKKNPVVLHCPDLSVSQGREKLDSARSLRSRATRAGRNGKQEDEHERSEWNLKTKTANSKHTNNKVQIQQQQRSNSITNFKSHPKIL